MIYKVFLKLFTSNTRPRAYEFWIAYFKRSTRYI